MDNKPADVDVFISYSHEDKELCKKLISHMSNLHNLQLIDSWHDGKISPGSEWEKQILDNLNRAQIILLLISADFLNSNYCYNIEAKRAMERSEQENVHVIPVILREVNWQGAIFSKLQALPQDTHGRLRPITSWENEDEAFSSVVQKIREVVETFSQSQVKNTSITSGDSGRIPPPTHSKSTVQREEAVKDIYTKLTKPDINALVLTGIGGIGKSTLASLVYAYTEKQRDIDNCQFIAPTVWITINPGYTTPQLVTELFKELGGNRSKLSLTPAKQAEELFHLLNAVDQTRLIILDQFENLLDMQTGLALPECAGIGEWLDALNSQPCHCRVLLTSRPFPRGTHIHPRTYLQEYSVRSLDLAEVTELLQKQGLEIPHTEVEIAFRHCQGHALSLILLASLLHIDHSLDLSTFFEDKTGIYIWNREIAQELLENIFERLNEDQRKLLSAFSIYREPVPLEAAQAVLVSSTISSKIYEKQQKAYKVLLTQHLLQASGSSRYQPHAIVADYARDHFTKQSKQANQKALHQAHARAALYYQQLAQNSKQKQQDISEMHPLIEAVWHLCQAEQWQPAYDLLEQKLFLPLKQQGGNPILLELYQQFLPLEKWHPANWLAARMYGRLGDIYRTWGQLIQAQSYLELAVQLCEQEKAGSGENWTVHDLGRDHNWALNNLGRISSLRKQFEQAQVYFEQALEVCRGTGNQGDEVTTLNELADTYRQQGKYEQARKYHEQALALSQKLKEKNRGKEATTLKFLGDTCISLGQKEQARKYYEEALGIQKEENFRGQAGKTLKSLGVLHSISGQQEKAITYYIQALETLREVGDRIEVGETLNHLAQAHENLKHIEEARKYFGEALIMYQELNDQEKEGTILSRLGTLYFKQNSFEIALAYFLQAQRIFEKIQSGYSNETQNKIDELRKKIGKRRFDTLLAQVEPQSALIIQQSLDK